MPSLIAPTYTDLLREAKSYQLVTPIDTNEIISRLGFQNLSLQSQSPILYIVDYSKNKYLYIDPSVESVLGYRNDWMANSGPSVYTKLLHPDDFKVLNKYITPDNLDFLQKTFKLDYYAYSFTINYRIQDCNGIYRKFLQRQSYAAVTDEGLPLVSVGFIVDITHFKEENSIIHTIEKNNPRNKHVAPELLHKKIYYPSNATRVFSRREVEILGLMYEGYNSREIATTLSLSIHTIHNHRKNLLKKSNTNSTTELLRYAHQSGLL